MKDTQLRVRKALWFPETADVILLHENLKNFKKWQSIESSVNCIEELRTFHNIKEHPRDVGRAGDISQIRCWTARLLENRRSNKTKLVNSDPCLSSQNTTSTKKCLRNQRNINSEIHVMNKRLPNHNLQNAPLISNLVYKKIAERKGRQFKQNSIINVKKTSIMDILPKLENTNSLLCYTFWDPCFRVSISLEQMTKEKNGNRSINSINATVEEHFGNISLKKAVTWNDHAKYYRYDLPTRHELGTKILRSIVSIKSNNSHIERLMSNNTVQAADDRVMQNVHRKSFFPTLKVLFGPYAQTHVVYNVMEQANAPVKEQGTSQQFKQRSQGIGSASISGNDSSSAPSKRRAIRIESGVSFSVEFTDRGKSSGSETSTPTPAASPSMADTKAKKGKKELHRCLCTLSFPTDDKKLKNKPCDSGVCVPGKCTPSECFKRLQEKYGSKKKSASDVSSSQASQTSKKLARAGKETVVKEKGSSSISKYQESTEVKPLPQKPKFDIVKTTKDCCDKYCKSYMDKYGKTILNKIQFWKKDKAIALKPAVIGTDISVKDDKGKSFGASASTQSGKIKGEVGKDDKGAGDKQMKKGKKDKKAEKKGQKKEEKKGKKKAEKGEKKTEKKTEKKAEKKPEKKGEKKGEKKASKKKDKKGAEKEVKTETKATGAKTVKGRPIKSYECEPGVCTPKVCSPKECYERKFPPPPPPKETTFSTIQNCLRKMCCRKPVEPAPLPETTGVSAATQARKAAVPEVTPGTPVYKATGSSPKERGGKKGEKTAFATAAQPPVEGGDIKPKKQTAYSGIQFFQTTDNDTMVQRQGVNIGSECSCSLEFFKMMY